MGIETTSPREFFACDNYGCFQIQDPVKYYQKIAMRLGDEGRPFHSLGVYDAGFFWYGAAVRELTEIRRRGDGTVTGWKDYPATSDTPPDQVSRFVVFVSYTTLSHLLHARDYGYAMRERQQDARYVGPRSMCNAGEYVPEGAPTTSLGWIVEEPIGLRPAICDPEDDGYADYGREVSWFELAPPNPSVLGAQPCFDVEGAISESLVVAEVDGELYHLLGEGRDPVFGSLFFLREGRGASCVRWMVWSPDSQVSVSEIPPKDSTSVFHAGRVLWLGKER